MSNYIRYKVRDVNTHTLPILIVPCWREGTVGRTSATVNMRIATRTYILYTIFCKTLRSSEILLKVANFQYGASYADLYLIAPPRFRLFIVTLCK